MDTTWSEERRERREGRGEGWRKEGDQRRRVGDECEYNRRGEGEERERRGEGEGEENKGVGERRKEKGWR
jgi:hypothetical protein